MLRNKNHSFATKGFQQFVNNSLHEVYGNAYVKVDRNTIKYAFCDDCDYAVVSETMKFTMLDGRTFEAYYEPKGRKSFVEIK